jgi:hypothetical protein
MSRIIILATFILSLIAHAQGQGDVMPRMGPFMYSILREADILVAEFTKLDPREESWVPGAVPLMAHVRVTRVLRDYYGLGLKPCELDVPIRISEFGIRPYYWTTRDPQAGQTYILFSESKGDLRSIITEPKYAERLTEGVDAIGDVELALKEAGRPIAEQANAVAIALSDGRLHSSLAGYAAVLLAAGSDADTVQLRRVLEGDGALALSDAAKGGLLSALRVMPGTMPEVSDNLIHVYVSLVIRYFILDTHEGRRGPIGVRSSTLQTLLPEIRASARDLAVLKSLTLSPQDTAILRHEALRYQSDGSQPQKIREEAGHMLELFPAR